MKDLFGNDTKLPVERVPGQRKAEVVHKQMITIYGKTEGQKCKGCASFYFRLFSKKYPKCKLSGCTEGNRNSDWNSRWDACGRFEPKETKQNNIIMFNHFNRAQKIESFLRHLGVSFDGLPAHIDDDDAQIITFFLTIDNHLKLKKIMDQFQDFVTSLQNENAVIANLGTAVAGLATTLQQVKTQLDTAAAQGMHIPAQQAQELSDLIGKGTSDASTALATAQAALTPAAPAADPNATTSGTAAGSTGSDSGQGSTDGSTPPAATDAVNG